MFLPEVLKNQRGQAAIILIVGVLLLVAIFTFNKSKITPKSSGPICPVVYEPETAPVISDIKPINGSGINSQTTNFIQIRGNVLIKTSLFAEHYQELEYRDKLVNGNTYDIYYPEGMGAPGEICIPREIPSKYRKNGGSPSSCDDSEGGGWRIYFPDFGIIFLVYKDALGKPVIIEGIDENGKEAKFYKTDIYQQESELKGIGTTPNPLPDDILTCEGFPSPTPKVSFPSQDKSPDKKELQLEYFLFEEGSIYRGWSAHCKPAIYLYPEKETQVNVKVNTKGELTLTIPPYPKDGWNATAYPDGKIIIDNKTYPYLYYESKLEDKFLSKPKKGYVVGFGELPNLFDLILPKLGLEPIHVKDFKDYWEKALPFSPYYFVGIIDQQTIDFAEPLAILPKPDSSIRVRLYFKALDKKPTEELSLPEIIPKKRGGFTLVEWGGAIKSDPTHFFTCIQ